MRTHNRSPPLSGTTLSSTRRLRNRRSSGRILGLSTKPGHRRQQTHSLFALRKVAQTRSAQVVVSTKLAVDERAAILRVSMMLIRPRTLWLPYK